MTCVEVRDRLPEHALGLLDDEEARILERHLEWCAGCRKERGELQEAAATMALSLPRLDPPASLEGRVVRAVAHAPGRAPSPRRRGVRTLGVVALAAATVAVGAVGWGVAERRQVETLRDRVRRVEDRQQGLAALLQRTKRQLGSSGRLFEASLLTATSRQAAGSALIFSAPRGSGFVLVHVVAPLPEQRSPYAVDVADAGGQTLRLGPLEQTESGEYVLYRDVFQDLSRPGLLDLSRVASLVVRDRTGRPALTGFVHRFVQARPSP